MTNREYILEDLENETDFIGREGDCETIKEALNKSENQEFLNEVFESHYEIALFYEKTLSIETISYSQK